jgi:hypothetical protein
MGGMGGLLCIHFERGPCQPGVAIAVTAILSVNEIGPRVKHWSFCQAAVHFACIRAQSSRGFQDPATRIRWKTIRVSNALTSGTARRNNGSD